MVGRLVAAACCLLALANAHEALAAESATAEALFLEGRKAMQRGNWPEATQLLAESQRLEPAPGTLLNLALAEEKLGRLSAAWEHARAAKDQLPPSDDRHRIAQHLFESLENRVPRIVLRSPNALPPDTIVKLDALELRPASYNVPLPIDPGSHKLVIQSPGHVERVVALRVEESTRTEQSIEPGIRIVGNSAVKDSPGHNETDATAPWPSLGWVGIGVGGASLVAGGITGYLAIDRSRIAERECTGQFCNPKGLEASDQGRAFATASTVTAITGVALAIAGTLLVVLSPTSKSRATTGQTGAGVPGLGFSF